MSYIHYKYEIVEGRVCGTCVHYRQHYVFTGGEFTTLWYGHCRCPRRKIRTPDQVCDYWEPVKDSPCPDDLLPQGAPPAGPTFSVMRK